MLDKEAIYEEMTFELRIEWEDVFCIGTHWAILCLSSHQSAEFIESWSDSKTDKNVNIWWIASQKYVDCATVLFYPWDNKWKLLSIYIFSMWINECYWHVLLGTSGKPDYLAATLVLP